MTVGDNSFFLKFYMLSLIYEHKGVKLWKTISVTTAIIWKGTTSAAGNASIKRNADFVKNHTRWCIRTEAAKSSSISRPEVNRQVG